MNNLEYVKRLDSLGQGQSAALRRSAGRALREADARALAAFYASMGPNAEPQRWQWEIYFAVGCLYCMWRPEDRKNPKPFVECVADLGQNDGLDAHFRALLDTDGHETDFLTLKLYRLTRRIKANGGFPDFKRLLEDLLRWNHPDKKAQLKWAREYFGRKALDEKNEETDEDVQEADWEADEDTEWEETDDVI
jgi:CRISPR system Cascade subunit CasB